MVDKRLLDTDIVIAFFRGNAGVTTKVADYLTDHDRLTITIITYYELLRGLRYINAKKQLDELERFVSDIELLLFDVGAVQAAADIYVSLRQRGQLIGDADILNASIALENNYVFVTNNMSHFARIRDLTIENWMAGA